ncbi:TonB-dependent receptor [Brevundimonas sp. NIBR11]|uniref:TonB-dependent receptor n=1 Tax=Brevundimonas sp. NIBR11 TaxID=3015999 RepID=UPI0022F09429|nr:TonB-dependent receptor [Brevundimonas sp. NIBR11]WGM32209.1 Vitamin B12 transporter BtuB [Brevundimonas sp. NIBR11]
MRLTQLLRCTASAAVVGSVAFGFAGAASAQDGQDGPASSVDDIIVTAQLREQSLQDVPVVVTSLSAEALDNAGVRDIKDLTILTPGMTVTSTQSEASTTARIRGVGTVGDNPGLESSVGVVIDGVYRSRNGVGFGDLGELSRIEVLKGPQGTLFGKNTSAGVINIITEAPSFTEGYQAEVTGGNYGAWGVSGSITGPISDTVAYRLYAATRQRDGFYDVNLGDGPRTQTDDGNQDFYTLRGQLLILPSDNASVRIIADYSKRDEYCCVGVVTRSSPTAAIINALTAPNGPGTAPQAPAPGVRPFNRLAYANRETGQQMEDMGLSVEANIDIPSWNARLTSVTSFRDWSTVNGQDIDYTGADILYRPSNGDYGYELSNLTQEFRLAGTSDKFDWLVGGFATLEDIGRDDTYYFGSDYNPFLSLLLTSSLSAQTGGAIAASPARLGCFSGNYNLLPAAARATYFLGCLQGNPAAPSLPGAPLNILGQGVVDKYSQRSESLALFTNNTWRATEQLEFTLGLRYTLDNKRLLGLQDNVNGNGASCAAVLGNQAVIVQAFTAALGSAAAGAAAASGLIGPQCLPWNNVLYDNRGIREEHDDGVLSGTIKAAYRFNDSLMVYGSYARGYKGFGYNMDRVQTGVTPDASLYFPAETVDSYEAGFKATLLDRSLLLNATYFYQAFEDFQLNTFLGTAFVVESIPELTTKGVDADMMWFTPIEGLTLSGGVTYTDAEYGVFTAADLTSAARFPQLSLLPGSRPSFAPEWSLSSSINFDRSIGNGLRAGFAVSAKYMTEYNTGSDLIPFKLQEDFTVVNGRISIGSEDERWTLEAWAQNLTDEEYVQVAYNSPLQGTAFQSTVQPNGTYYNPALDTQGISAFLGAPRTYGATLRLKY